MATHTPAPWIVNPAHPTEVVSPAEAMVICRLPGALYMKASPANARLIAAAPEMLTEGRFLLDRLDEFERDGLSGYGEREWIGHVAPAIARFRAAIAKADCNSNPETGSVSE